jgi:hypothetical protein
MTHLIRPVTLAWLGLVAMLWLSVARAQHGDPASLIVSPPEQARQYDFMIGEWALTARPKLGVLARLAHGEIVLTGTWKVRPAMNGWGVQDELQLIDDSGNPSVLVAATRFYDARKSHWMTTSLDVYRGRQTLSTARRVGTGMQGETHSQNDDSKQTLTRATISPVDENHFVFRQDRSYDDGQTWDEAALVIEASRKPDSGSP